MNDLLDMIQKKPGRSEFETVFKAFKFQISHFSKVEKPLYQAYFTLYMI